MKKKKLRVIQISGLRGLLSAAFVVVCLAAGFVGFPALVITKVWNNFLANSGIIPVINLFQGFILWGILAVSYMILNQKNRYLMAFEAKSPNPVEIRNILNEIQAHSSEIKKDLNVEKSDLSSISNVKVSSQEKEEDKEVV